MNMNNEMRDRLNTIMNLTGIGGILYTAYVFLKQYDKKDREAKRLKKIVKTYDNIFIGNVLNEIVSRWKEGKITEYEKYRILIDNNIQKELEDGIMMSYPTATAYVDDKLRILRASGSYMVSGKDRIKEGA